MHGTLDRPKWTATRVDDLRRMIEQKYSSSQAAVELGITRSAAIGKAHRLGINFKSEIKTNSTVQATVRRKRIAQRKFKVIPMEPEPDSRNLEFGELEKNDCRYPVTEDRPFLFCGQPKAEGSSYCAHHHHKCWQPAPARVREARPR